VTFRFQILEEGHTPNSGT